MNKGVTIVFTAKKLWTSRLIRWSTGSRVSHVYIEYPSELWGGRWAAEATVSGVRKVIVPKARKGFIEEFHSTLELQKGLASISKYFGERYDFIGVARFGLPILFWRWFRVKIRHVTRDSKSQFCSELVARVFKNAGLPGTNDWNVETVDPETLYQYCKQNPVLFEVVEK